MQLDEKKKQEALQEYLTFLSFQSISTDPQYKPHVTACANWLTEWIKKHHGFEVEQWPTSGNPIIFAKNKNPNPQLPTLLIYNRYDVQPVDPLEEWHSPPFQPTIKNGEVYARGAQDNKGQCFYVLQALKAMMQKNQPLPINIKLCIEGEEECASKSLAEILKDKKRREQLKSDYLVIVDMGLQDKNTPAVTLGVRGLVTMGIHVQGSSTDLHSGSQGGIVYNPLHALVEILSNLRDSNGKITIPGFYDDVLEMSPEEKAQIALKFDSAAYEKMFGAKAEGGEKQFTPLERAWMRPTLEINGISGGYSGEGFKTVIPAKAHAKISCRLVPNQDPAKIGNLVTEHIKKLAPKGVKIDVEVYGGGKAIRANPSSPVVKAFAKAYEELFKKPCEYIYSGGSIPIVTELAEASESEVILMGFGLPDDQIHAPNEHFGLDRLEKGQFVVYRAIELLMHSVFV